MLTKENFYRIVISGDINESIVNGKVLPAGTETILIKPEQMVRDNIIEIPYKKMRSINIERVIFNDPATIVLWKDGTKTIVKAQEGDDFDPEKGLAMAIAKKALGNRGNFNNIFHKWIPEEKNETIEDVFKKLREFTLKGE